MNKLQIISQLPAGNPPKREVTLLYKSGGAKLSRRLAVGRPTHFDQIIVAQRRLERQWPRGHEFSAQSVTQFAKSSARSLHRSVRSRLAPVEIPGPILDLRMLEPNNVAHILVNLVPYCLYVQANVRQPVTCLFRRTREPFRTLATRFGVSPVFLNGPVSGNFLQVFGTRGLAVYELAGVFDCEGINFFPAVYAGFTPTVPPPVHAERLFLARRGPRALSNHQRVEAFLTARGYTTVYFEDFSIDQQCALAAAAQDVVAVHGAAMSFLVLGSKTDSVIELLPPQIYHQLFAVALPQSIRHYTVVVQDFDPTLAYQPWSELVKLKNMAFEADLSLLEEALGGK